MKQIKKLITQYRIIASAMQKPGRLYYIKPYGNPEIFYKKAAEWGIRTYNTTDEIDRAIFLGLRNLGPFMSYGSSANALRNTIISRAYGSANYFAFSANQRKNIAIFINDDSTALAEAVLDRLNHLYKNEFNTSLELVPAPTAFADELLERIAAGEDYYINQHGEWTQGFIDHLSDDISKLSFRTFLKQRLEAYMLWGTPAMYPIQPPAETAEWRKERLKNKPDLPILQDCIPAARDFFHLHTYILEQYAVPGVVEALPGDVVIDAGAFNADTAIYFARKTGSNGKVYAFEADPKNIAAANKNLELNDCTNVNIMPLALSDQKGVIKFSQNPIASSGSIQTANGELSVSCTDLDSFVSEQGIRVDFIKSDIEGGEMNLLLGAQETIKRYAPTCGIALYHKQDDFVTIPKLLSQLRPDYKFYFRCEAEPVLFATIKG